MSQALVQWKMKSIGLCWLTADNTDNVMEGTQAFQKGCLRLLCAGLSMLVTSLWTFPSQMVLQGVSSCSSWSFILTVFQFEALEKLKVFCTHMCMPEHQIEVFAIAWYCGRLYEAVPSGAQSLEVLNSAQRAGSCYADMAWEPKVSHSNFEQGHLRPLWPEGMKFSVWNEYYSKDFWK